MLAYELRVLRKRLRVSQAELAAEAGLYGTTTISAIENGSLPIETGSSEERGTLLWLFALVNRIAEKKTLKLKSRWGKKAKAAEAAILRYVDDGVTSSAGCDSGCGRGGGSLPRNYLP